MSKNLLLGLKISTIHPRMAVLMPGDQHRLLTLADLRIHPAISALNYATAAIEGMQEQDGRILFPRQHFNRLLDSGDALDLFSDAPGLVPQYDQFCEALTGLYRVNRNRLTDGHPMYFRPILFEASAELGVDSAAGWACVIVTRAKTPYLGTEADCGVTIWAPGPQHFRRGDHTCGMFNKKVGSSYPLGHRWKRRAKQYGAREVLQFNLQGGIAETTGSNIFMVKDGVVFTPRLDSSILPGITRGHVIDFLRAKGIAVVETFITSEMFEEADEVFLTGTWSGVVPVAAMLHGYPNVEPWFQPQHACGPITGLAKESYFSVIRRQSVEGITPNPDWFLAA